MSAAALAAPVPSAAAQPPPAYRWRWVVLAIVLVAEIMDLLDSTVITIAAPTARSALGGSTAAMQWWAAGYTLAFGVLMIVGARLGDIYGLRRVFLARHRRLHARVGGVRARAVARRPHRHARAPGRLRRAADPAGARRHQDRLPAEGDGRRVRRVRAGHGPRRHRRADPRGLARHGRPARHRVADDLPAQRPARRDRPARGAAVHARVEVVEPHPPGPAGRAAHQCGVAGHHLPA